MTLYKIDRLIELQAREARRLEQSLRAPVGDLVSMPRDARLEKLDAIMNARSRG